jgi:hypothetical protein
MCTTDAENGHGTLPRDTDHSFAEDAGSLGTAINLRAQLEEIERAVDALLSGNSPLPSSASPEVKAMLAVSRLLEREARALRARSNWTVLSSATA